MLNDSNYEEKMFKDVTGESLEYEDPRRYIRDFYKEYCEVIKNNMRTTHNGEEVYLHDILMDMNLLGHEGSCNVGKVNCGHKKEGDVWRDNQGIPRFALSSEKLRVLKEKFSMVVKNDLKYLAGEAADDTTKNFFKIMCGIVNIPLKQRGRNPLKDQVLIQFLDTINFDVQDNDLIILNQLASLKKLAERKSFSLTVTQVSLIH